MAATFSLKIDDRTDEERERDRKKYEANEKDDAPMDTKLQEDLGPVRPQIGIDYKVLQVKGVNWKNWSRNLGIIREDPGGSNTVTQSERCKEHGQRNVSRQRSKRQTVQEGPEIEPLASSSV